MEKLVLMLCGSLMFCLLFGQSVTSVMKVTPDKRDVADNTALQSTTVAYKGENSYAQHYQPLGAPSGCPIEYSSDTRVTKGESFYHVGDHVTSECHSEDSDWGFNYDNFPHKFFLYPSMNRTCLPKGIWSTPLPICVNVEVNKRSENIEVRPRKSNSTKMNHWQKVGKLQSKCDGKISGNRKTRDPNSKFYSVLYTFEKHEYWSFVTIELPHGLVLTDFSVYTKKTDVLGQLSDEAMQFQKTHFDEFMKIHPQTEDEVMQSCAIIELSVYSNQLIVRYSIDKQMFRDNEENKLIGKVDYEDSVRFFAIISQSAGSDNDQECPQKPSIVHAISEGVKGSSNDLVYACTGGRTLVDPITHQISDGKIKCLYGVWSPYPFPVCYSIIKVKYPSIMNETNKSNKMVTGEIDEKAALQNTNETSVNEGKVDEKETTEITVQYAALFVGVVIVGVAVILICIYCLKIRDHRKMSKNQAGTIEKRHDVYKDRSSEDSKGYTFPLPSQEWREYAARDQIKEDDEGYLVPSRESGRLLIDLPDERENTYITPNEPRKQEAIVPNGWVSPCQSSRAPGTNLTSDHMPIYEPVERLDDGYAQV